MAKLSSNFFQQSTLEVARSLLGCQIIHVLERSVLSGFIVETEAYLSENDPACHAARGKTDRNQVMFGPPGCLYVYSIHNRFCMNVVTEETGKGAAVLIRAAEPVQGREVMLMHRPVVNLHELTNGPGKLCQAFGLSLASNGDNLLESKKMWLESKSQTMHFAIRSTPRIGISQAKEFSYRFFVDGNPFVSGRAKDHTFPRDRYLGTTRQEDFKS